ncbi:WAT1-related protein [Tripterygium wilfordii]|uniref:WAT1-related protein n=1 Tax=Tripterygium wilfordii TaxID=458696 RepID=A0A7J7CIB7_TRIWF|nr:WAT1-related protein [Tripterygium wilfordii]
MNDYGISYGSLWLCRLEKVNMRNLHSQAKISGTIVTVEGAMLITLIKGPMLNLPWQKDIIVVKNLQLQQLNKTPIKGALMITVGCFCWQLH